MATLYRQYRPQTFAEIFGQPHVTETLQQAIKKDRLSHAYLFHGPRGTGKTTAARVFAKRLNCINPKGSEPCTKCKLCQATQRGQNMDLIEIDAASNRGIDDIRALRDTIGLTPSMGKYKVYIIDEVHMLTNEAFAALLKTLEEPVKHAIFILATTELHKVPATILSRCQVYRFRRATDEELASRLKYLLKQEKREADNSALKFIISRSDGCYRDAESLLGQMLTLQDERVTSSDITSLLGLPPIELTDTFLAALVQGNAKEAVEQIDRLYEEGFDLEQFLHECIRHARDGALALAKEDEASSFARQGRAQERLPQIIRALLQALQDLAYVPQPVIALQLAVLTVCSHSTTSTPVRAMTRVARPTQTSALSKKAKEAEPATSPPSAEPEQKAIVSLDKLKSVWDELIRAVKEDNPVASTFLRATEAMDVKGSTMTMRVQYGLHRNFFEKPENKSLIETKLGELLGVPITIICQLEEPGSALLTPAQRKQHDEEQLLRNVKEVFGVKS